MQTFLPWDDFFDSAGTLDRLRLGKQRVEAMQILNALEGSQPHRFPTSIELFGPQIGWVNHPAVLMWKNYEHALCLYGIEVCNEWTSRGYKDGVRNRFLEFLEKHYTSGVQPVPMPPWLGREEFHESHRAALVAKDHGHYSELFPGTAGKLNYWWPTEHGFNPETGQFDG